MVKMKKIYALTEYAADQHLDPKVVELLEVLPNDIAYKFYDNAGISKLARAEGLEVFDTALPIDWVRAFELRTGFNPVGHFVMGYDDNTFGFPVAVTVEGKVAEKIYNHVVQTSVK